MLNRDGAHHLKSLFESFLAFNTYPNVSFIVVDHASSDDSVEILLSYRQKADIDIILYDSNNSFSSSNNLAAKRATSDYLFFLNNDILFESDPIPRLVEYLSDSSIGIVGLKLLYPEGQFSAPSQRSGIFSAMKRFMGYDSLKKPNATGDTRERVQHAGVRLFEDDHNAVYRGYNLGSVHGIDEGGRSKSIFPAVTAAAMVCRREEFLRAGGFCEEYVYGNEDIDLCLTYMSYLKKAIVFADELSLVHDESATQKLSPPKELFQMRKKNWDVLKRRYGYGIRRAFHRDLVAGDRFWSGVALKAAFAVTDAHKDAKAGDYYTAMELACACEEELGWSVKFLARNEDWYDLEDIDVLIVMVDAYDLSRMRSPKPSLIKVAWMRNWFDRWADRDSFDGYDIFLCSCRKGLDFITGKGKKAHLFPIATNEKRFRPEAGHKEEPCDYCFTGHKWSVTRDIEAMLNPSEVDYRFAVYGNNWDDHDTFGAFWRGFAPYGELASIYANTRVVIDDAVNGITKPWGSMNSRVFDALASGALVITNNTAGTEELFGDRLPTYSTREELYTVLNRFLGDENHRKAQVHALRTEVLDKHTYRKRSLQLRSMLTEFYENKYRISIKVPVPRKEEAEQWGDYHFALGLKRAFVKYGHAVRIDLMPDWETPLGFADDVVIVLRGLSRYTPKPDHINIMWNISHPDTITAQEYEAYDHVFVASQIYAEVLREMIMTPVTALLQCTDTDLFYQDAKEDVPAHDVLFVGNSRKQTRKIVKDAIDSDLPLSVYGSLWEGLIPERYIRGTYIKNQSLRCFYSRCKILLNDHWPSMGDKGFISNRIFDAGSCGTCIVSDNASGMETLFGDAVPTYQNAGELKDIVFDLLLSDQKRRTCGEKMRDIVISGHTFEHRAGDILKIIEKVHSSKKIEFTLKKFESVDLPNSPELAQDTV
ncbi:MAG TPA: glycosyltransferase [Syntrophales bacterium]|nr:glycosyltransferase [Syntrophales bacterium]